MKECDIFRGGGVKTYSGPSCIFSEGHDPLPSPKIYPGNSTSNRWSRHYAHSIKFY